MPSSDVVVVGGGPAGSVTAMLLARAGYSVDLLERQHFPRAKACGDCISPGANTVLHRLGLWDEVSSAGPALLRGWALWCAEQSGFQSEFENAAVSLALPRAKLDAILLAAAAKAGARIHTGWRLTELLQDGAGAVRGVRAEHDGTHRAYGARLVIGADGLRSRVARLLDAYTRRPRIRKLSLTTHVRGVRCHDAFGEMHVFRDACLGIARVEAGSDPLYNVTIVLRAGRAHASGTHSLMRRALSEMGRADIATLVTDQHEMLASGPFDWPVRQVAFDGAMLVGDAAGYFDPFTGQGIYQALAGAELAAQHGADALRKADTSAHALAGYEQAHRALYAPTRRLQRVVDFVCARPAFTNAAFQALAHSRSLAGRFLAVTGDMRPARSLLLPRP